MAVQHIILFDALTLLLGAVAVSLLQRMRARQEHKQQEEEQRQTKRRQGETHREEQQWQKKHGEQQSENRQLLPLEREQQQQQHLQDKRQHNQADQERRQKAPSASAPIPQPSPADPIYPSHCLSAFDPSHLQLLLHCLLFPLSLFLLSPILRTLASTIASDTITSSSLFLLLLHLFFHDYSYATATTPSFSGNLALLSSVFASVLLSSRLNSDASAFAFLWLALQLFALLPCLQHHLRQLYPDAHDAAAVVTTALLLLACSVRSRHLAVVLAAAVLLLSLVVPAVLVGMQRYKMEIKGPWDEAKLVVGS